ncbi:UDP-N-acetylglucosamine 1-carboxyvinyltransferase [Alphaproteobacteria bacterium]|nr:UDP-N-acetylglucosamine 1-carboxyvinyltransferase [Alphaproteobacteria bacterium]
MDKIDVYGGQPLKGTIPISGAKNAALPLMCAALLTGDPLVLKNVPHLSDITSMARLLGDMGVGFQLIGSDQKNQGHMGRVVSLHGKELAHSIATYELVRKMRASILVLGPLLARTGKAKVSLPGGCAIGTRPVDLHIKGLEDLGAKIKVEDGYIHAHTPQGSLIGNDVHMAKVTVTGTENLMMAATLAKGKTTLHNAALEPEVVDLANCLISMGAKIDGAGTHTITIHGVASLGGTTHTILPDRIETGTYMVAAGLTGGELFLEGGRLDILPTFTDILARCGIASVQEEGGIRVKGDREKIKAVSVETAPYPGFPTDLQAQFMTLMCFADQPCTIHETIFENRFMHVSELSRLGSQIDVSGNIATVTPSRHFKGADVMATDLRASVALVLAGLVGEGKTTVHRVYHLDRGYERVEEKFQRCGANVQRVLEGAPTLKSVSVA